MKFGIRVFGELRTLTPYVLLNTFGWQQWLVSPSSLVGKESLCFEDYKVSDEAGSLQDNLQDLSGLSITIVRLIIWVLSQHIWTKIVMAY